MPNCVRAFIVGCPRSGTTLLQSMLGAHPAIYTLPETHFFARTLARSRALRRLSFADSGVRRFLRDKLSEIPGGIERRPRGIRAFSVPAYGHAFAECLDALTRAEGKTAWVEKTPQHLHRIDVIRRGVNRARFVHVLRAGEDAIASLYQVTNTYAEQWGGKRSLEDCIDRWVADVGVSRSLRDAPRHHFVVYERLIVDPRGTLADLSRWLELDFDNRMLRDYSSAYRTRVAETGAEWTSQAASPLARGTRQRKFETSLSPQQREMVSCAIQTAGLDDIESLFHSS